MPKTPHKEQIMKLCRIMLKASGPQDTQSLIDTVSVMYHWVPNSRGLGQWLYADGFIHRHGFARRPDGGMYTVWCLKSLCLHKERTLSLRHPNATETDDRSG